MVVTLLPANHVPMGVTALVSAMWSGTLVEKQGLCKAKVQTSISKGWGALICYIWGVED